MQIKESACSAHIADYKVTLYETEIFYVFLAILDIHIYACIENYDSSCVIM